MDTQAKILVIDDEEGIRKGCVRVLKPRGFTVQTASSFQEGMKRIGEELFDLILLDVMLPDGRGVNLLKPILERDPETIAVVITGYATAELAVEAIRQGAYNFIAKPFTADVLLITVNQGLEKRQLSLNTKRMRELEQEAIELAQAREQAERLYEFKTNFATLVAHELRSPVAGVQSLVRTMLRGMAGELTEQQAQLLGRVNIRLDFLMMLINDLLTLAASKSLESDRPLEPVCLAKVFERVSEHYRDEAQEKQINLEVTPPDASLQVSATEDGLEAVLRNLLCNAIKYTPSKGQVQVLVSLEGNTAQIRVCDTGIGISPDDIPHIGEEFYRTKEAHQKGIPGTGLGMSIVKQYLERFGGQLKIESQVGQGTTFTVTLPIWVNAAV
jgi:two-component system sensor histidine kinase/response regulator